MTNKAEKDNAIVTSDSETESIFTASTEKKNNRSMLKRKMSNLNKTDDTRLEAKRAANRRSAFESRQRRKLLVEDLQRSVSVLTKENSNVRKENDDLHRKFDMLVQELNQYKLLVQLAMTTRPAAVPTPQLKRQDTVPAAAQPILSSNLQTLLKVQGLIGNHHQQQQQQPKQVPAFASVSKTTALDVINDTPQVSASYVRMLAKMHAAV